MPWDSQYLDVYTSSCCRNICEHDAYLAEPELDKGPAVEGDDENEEEIVESDIPGFQKWLGFAKERKCHLGEYKQIKKDLGVSPKQTKGSRHDHS